LSHHIDVRLCTHKRIGKGTKKGEIARGQKEKAAKKMGGRVSLINWKLFQDGAEKRTKKIRAKKPGRGRKKKKKLRPQPRSVLVESRITLFPELLLSDLGKNKKKLAPGGTTERRRTGILGKRSGEGEKTVEGRRLFARKKPLPFDSAQGVSGKRGRPRVVAC